MNDVRTLKEEGLAKYKNGDFKTAAECWRESVDMLGDLADAEEGEELDFSDWDFERSLYLNLAMAHLKCHEPREALRALKCILLGGEDEPEIMLKTLYRMALCHKELGEWDDFDRCARAMLEVDGESVLAKRLIQEATSLRA
ncbi:hypothetical protein FOZ61_010924, partial [Perkinsus olseni]